VRPDTTAIPALLALHDTPDASLYRRLLRDARRSRRCPVLLDDATLERCGYEMKNDLDPIEIDDADPYAVLSEWWPGPCHPDCPCEEPLAASLAPLTRAGRDLSRHHATIAAATEVAEEAVGIASMAVVDAARPADIPLALLWSGMVNYGDRDLPRAGAVLRSWEERFGAVVAFIGPATLLLAVARPPRTVAESEIVAAEHFAFCPDQVDPQDGTGPLSVRAYAQSIRGHFLWRFWWD
jgi:hypothetical protein